MPNEVKAHFAGHYANFYKRYLKKVHSIGGDEFMALCPFHDDSEPSFNFNNKTGQYYCHGCNKKGDAIHFYAKQHGLDTKRDFRKVMQGIADDFSISLQEKPKAKMVDAYNYVNEAGEVIFQVCRMEPKDFRQRQPNGKGGWIWNMKDVERVLYHLPQVMKAQEVIIVEGEKDADNVSDLGFTATTNPGGAKKWLDSYKPYLKGKDIVLMPDNDAEGREHMTRIAISLDGTSKSMKWIDLPGLPIKGDVSDWIAKFPDKEEAGEGLAVMIDGADPYEPPKREEVQGEPEHPDSNSPTMADVQVFLDFGVQPGMSFKADYVCRGIGAYNREHKKAIYTYLGRLVKRGSLVRDDVEHGGFHIPLAEAAYDLAGDISENTLANAELPLEIEKLLNIGPNQIIAVSGRYDAGKSSFLFHTMQLNYHEHKIIHFSSPEWDIDTIKKRLDELGIERPHPNVICYPMKRGFEDLIPEEKCIVLVDYIRTTDNPYSIDRDFHRIFAKLHGGVCLAAIQKHPGLDKPTGGQFAVHAPQHVILLDKMKSGDFICKIFKTKHEKDLEGLTRTFKFNWDRALEPLMKDWLKKDIVWEKDKKERQQ